VAAEPSPAAAAGRGTQLAAKLARGVSAPEMLSSDADLRVMGGNIRMRRLLSAKL